ncbi:uncharacterized protein N7446_007933 [Penicillium canescens]|uniref:uncharacterized protein n=1 Tax=Penicillium canescens TaxID=5083 RepID=UPI0026DED431|nr:uncharacterized protein N7446_007933 [Penicillium canescens]KAJ6058350.1 hypothetical protein N7446_007933 [Penicillium canescens]
MPSSVLAGLLKLVVTATIVIMLTAFRFMLTAFRFMLTAVRARRRQPLEAPKPKSLTFRIDDIPIDHTKELVRNIRSVAKHDPVLRGAAATIVHHSVAPKDKRFICATVSITTPLSGEDLCARLHRSGKCYPYSYTCKFDGITPLYEDEKGADIDVIAVTGLGGHALGSWKSRNSDEVWLRDFLPGDMPNIRVLLYGYDTTLPGSQSRQSIGDLGSAFLEQVTAFRANDGTSRRPTILIGHSLGGLLIKEGQPNKALIDSLLVDNDSEPSLFLKRIADQFSESCKGHYRVVTFFERTLSPTLERSKDGRWCRTGRRSLLVTEKSATSTGLVAVADEDNIPLNTDHSGLVKYNSRNQGDYLIVRERLRRLANEAKLEVPKRFAEHTRGLIKEILRSITDSITELPEPPCSGWGVLRSAC